MPLRRRLRSAGRGAAGPARGAEALLAYPAVHEARRDQGSACRANVEVRQVEESPVLRDQRAGAASPAAAPAWPARKGPRSASQVSASAPVRARETPQRTEPHRGLPGSSARRAGSSSSAAPEAAVGSSGTSTIGQSWAAMLTTCGGSRARPTPARHRAGCRCGSRGPSRERLGEWLAVYVLPPEYWPKRRLQPAAARPKTHESRPDQAETGNPERWGGRIRRRTRERPADGASPPQDGDEKGAEESAPARIPNSAYGA